MSTAQTLRGQPLKRLRRTQEQVAQLDEQLLAVLRYDHPQSVRHLFYRMTDPRLPEPVPKTDTDPKYNGGLPNGYAAVQRRLVKLRRDGRVPYSWITDATRRGYHVPTYGSVSEFLSSVAGLYRGELWLESPYYCEVWTESRSLAGVIEGVCQELAVSLYPAGGFSSISLAYQAADYLASRRDGKPAVIFYIGDYDPAGVLIDQALERELREHLEATIELEFVRLAITEEQIEAHDLPTKPRKLKDRRAPHIKETVEAESLPANILREILRAKVEALLPQDALASVQAAEESERREILKIAEMVA